MYKVNRLYFQDKINLLICTLFCLFLCCGILLYPDASASGAFNALKTCALTLLPSLFPFMFLSQFFVYSSVAQRISFLFSYISKKLFKLPAVAGITVFLSLIGGYPVGAKAIKALYDTKQISHSCAERMAYFCFGGGPAFIMGMVGSVLLKSYMSGIILFFSQASAAVIIGIALSLGEKKEEISTKKNVDFIRMNFSDSFTKAAHDASGAMITMCALVIVFGAITSLMSEFKINDGLSSILCCLGINKNISQVILPIIFEVTNASFEVINKGAPIEVLAFALGFGGVSVHFQVYSILSDIRINKLKFTFLRVVQGILSALLTYIVFKFLPYEQDAVMIFSKNAEITSSGNLPCAVSLVIMCCIFAVSFNSGNKYLKG